MPHIIEPASSGRAKCRACKESIGKGALRLGEEVPNAFGDGQATHWYHLVCGARRRPEAFLDAWASRQAEGIASNDVGAPTEAEALSLIAVAEKAKVYPRLSRFVKVHAAPSGRARCQGCHQLVEKGALRFVLERIEDGMVSGGGFVHIGCAREYAGSVAGIEERVRPLSELSDAEWGQVVTALSIQAALGDRPPAEADAVNDEPAEDEA
jgi:Poly(ADP-ribose) polymerase and DNA-Ligase Zn-finger region